MINNIVTEFNITGTNRGENFSLIGKEILFASSAKEKCLEKGKNTNCTIVLGKVITGTIVPGNNIIITRNGGKTKIEDSIAMIEVGGIEAESAGKGKMVGICLEKSKLKDFKKL